MSRSLSRDVVDCVITTMLFAVHDTVVCIVHYKNIFTDGVSGDVGLSE